MELALIVWLISSLDAIIGFFVAMAFICGVAAFASVCAMSEGVENAAGYFKKSILVGILCIFAATILPDSKTGWMMGGAYLTQQAVQSETAKKFGAIIEKKMLEVLDETTEQAKIKAKSINEQKE